MHTAELCFRYESVRTATVIADAVGQELGEIDGDRATTTLARDGRQLTVEIDADDLVALRAGMNTWGTLLEVAERMADSRLDTPRDS